MLCLAFLSISLDRLEGTSANQIFFDSWLSFLLDISRMKGGRKLRAKTRRILLSDIAASDDQLASCRCFRFRRADDQHRFGAFFWRWPWPEISSPGYLALEDEAFKVSGQCPAVNGLAPLCGAGVSARPSLFSPRGRSARSSSDTKPLDGHSSKQTFAEKIPC